RAHLDIQFGGIMAAVRTYGGTHTPNVLVVETEGGRDTVLAELSHLADVCDSSTKVIVVGHVNDVVLYRELIRSGVSEYLVAPRAGRSMSSKPLARSMPIPRLARSVASLPLSEPRAASARAPLPTMSAGCSRASSRSTRSSPISIWPSAPPASTSTSMPPRA